MMRATLEPRIAHDGALAHAQRRRAALGDDADGRGRLVVGPADRMALHLAIAVDVGDGEHADGGKLPTRFFGRRAAPAPLARPHARGVRGTALARRA
jgi:hypothetical protein